MVRKLEISNIKLMGGDIIDIANRIMTLSDQIDQDNFNYSVIDNIAAECRKKVGFDSHKRPATNREFEKYLHNILVEIMQMKYGYEQAVLMICISCDVDIQTVYNHLKRYYKLKNGKTTLANRKEKTIMENTIIVKKTCCNCKHRKIVVPEYFHADYYCRKNNNNKVNPDDTCPLGDWDENLDLGPDWEY